MPFTLKTKFTVFLSTFMMTLARNYAVCLKFDLSMLLFSLGGGGGGGAFITCPKIEKETT